MTRVAIVNTITVRGGIHQIIVLVANLFFPGTHKYIMTRLFRLHGNRFSTLRVNIIMSKYRPNHSPPYNAARLSVTVVLSYLVTDDHCHCLAVSLLKSGRVK